MDLNIILYLSAYLYLEYLLVLF